MYLRDNPVLQYEFISNLRKRRALALLFFYPALLSAIVLLAWPEAERIDTTNPEASKRLVTMFFLGQFFLAGLLTPTFAAGAIAGERERQTLELLVATPLRPSAIVLGKLLASLGHLVLLAIASLPIVMLCLPLGGVSFYEVLAAYFALLVATVVFGLIAIAASSFFHRTMASLAVSYLFIGPLVAVGAWLWTATERSGALRLYGTSVLLPVVGAVFCIIFVELAIRKLMYPEALGSEGRTVVDETQELRHAVGLVIQRGHFPDRLFAPAKRDDLLPDGANPVFDKEIRSEVFAQGTLMLRVVIQISMLLALPMMFFCLYLAPHLAPWYVSYVLMFNVLVGPLFSAGAITSEREQQTLELLLTTTLSPWQILWAKLLAGLRVSSALTALLLWPLLLACVLVQPYWNNLASMAIYVAVVLLSCVTTATVALGCSVVSKKTSVSLMTSYVVVALLFVGAPAALVFVATFFPNAHVDRWTAASAAISPISAVFHVPLHIETTAYYANAPAGWAWLFATHLVLNGSMLFGMLWLFRNRWRVLR